MSGYISSMLVMGGTQGMGYHCALALAQQCPSSLIVVACRTNPEDVGTSINVKLRQSHVKFMPLNVGSLEKERDFARSWDSGRFPPIQVLIINACVQCPGGVEYSVDGIEETFAINHVGHALLFHLLVPKLMHNARIMAVSSGVHDPVRK
ncbi:hypothetical protein ACN47E_009635 [Coniothyrium glycines]